MSSYKLINTDGVPIKAWVQGVPLEAEALQQLKNTARLPIIRGWVAAMPDVHWGIGATVGSVIPTVDAIPVEVGKPSAAALDCGYWSPTNVEELTARGIEPYIATGQDRHHQSWQQRFAQEPESPPAAARQIVKMAYKLKTDIGKQIYGLRKSTVEPVIGIIKEILGFRQFSLRGLVAVAGEWCLVCLA